MKKGIITTAGILTGFWAFGQSVDAPLSIIMGYESIAIGIVFKLVFIAQIFGVSFFLPQFITRKTVEDKESSERDKRAVTRYMIMNNANVVIGLVALGLITFHPMYSSVTGTLLTIGVYFIIQLTPIMFNKQIIDCQKDTTLSKSDSITLFTFVHPVIAGIAVLLFFAYITMALITWNWVPGTWLLQMIIFIGSNIYLVLMMNKSFTKVKHLSGEEWQKQISNLMKMVPTFFYLSIGVSIYYFGKMLLLDFGWHELRPIMMSLALLFLGLLISNQVGKYTTSEE